MLKLNEVYHGDCFDVMPQIDDKSIDMILCDLPYGMTNCAWDTPLPLDILWTHYKRIIKDNGVIVLTGCQPFTSRLVMSNPKWFKYEIIWEKHKGSNYANVNKMVMKVHENILIFYKKNPIYNPQKFFKGKAKSINKRTRVRSEIYGEVFRRIDYINEDGMRYPRSVIKFKGDSGSHPTQKPVALFEWLIKTYTNEGMIVLDNCAGSATTAIACLNTNRNFICIEKEKKYIDIAQERIAKRINFIPKKLIVKRVTKQLDIYELLKNSEYPCIERSQQPMQNALKSFEGNVPRAQNRGEL